MVDKQDEGLLEAIESDREGTQEAVSDHQIAGERQENAFDAAGIDEALVIADAVADPVSSVHPLDTLKAVIEAAIYITDEPLTAEQIAAAVQQPLEQVNTILAELQAEYAAPHRGLSIRELAGGYKMATKPEHHESIRRFVNKLQPPLKLSLAALETLAVVAYKQPITAPEILDIRGVQGAGVLKTLLDRKLIAAAGRKNVLGKPILYKTTREFLVQFGLNSLAELPTLKEFEELGRFALTEGDESQPETETAALEQVETSADEQAALELEDSVSVHQSEQENA